jgi:hypothetical protein
MDSKFSLYLTSRCSSVLDSVSAITTVMTEMISYASRRHIGESMFYFGRKMLQYQLIICLQRFLVLKRGQSYSSVI